MKKMYIFTLITIIANIYNNVNSHEAHKYNFGNCNLNIGQSDTINQSDLEEVDKYINDHLLSDKKPIISYYMNTPYNNSKKLSRNINNNTLSYEMRNNNQSSNTKQSKQSNYNSKFKTFRYNNDLLQHNSTYKILLNHNNNIIPKNLTQNNNNCTLSHNNTYRVLYQTDTNNLSFCTGNEKRKQSVNNQISDTVNNIRKVLTESEMNSIFTKSDIQKLNNKTCIILPNNTVVLNYTKDKQNNNAIENNTNDTNQDVIKVKDKKTDTLNNNTVNNIRKVLTESEMNSIFTKSDIQKLNNKTCIILPNNTVVLNYNKDKQNNSTALQNNNAIENNTNDTNQDVIKVKDKKTDTLNNNTVNNIRKVLTESEMNSILTNSEIQKLKNNECAILPDNTVILNYENEQLLNNIISNNNNNKKTLTNEKTNKIFSDTKNNFTRKNSINSIFSGQSTETIVIKNKIPQPNKQSKNVIHKKHINKLFQNNNIKKTISKRFSTNNCNYIRNNTYKFLTDINKVSYNNNTSKLSRNKKILNNTNSNIYQKPNNLTINVDNIQYNACITDRNYTCMTDKNYNDSRINSNNKKNKFDLTKGIIQTSSNKKNKINLMRTSNSKKIRDCFKKIVMKISNDISNNNSIDKSNDNFIRLNNKHQHEIKLLNKRVILKDHNTNNNTIDTNNNMDVFNTNTITNNINNVTPNTNITINSVSNSINTDWDKYITQEEVDEFFNNIKESNAFENATMQLYSLLGTNTPSLGNSDKIRLIFDIINYNKSNRNETHYYNYSKPLSIIGTFIDYYLNNIETYNEDIEQFVEECFVRARNISMFGKNDYLEALEILSGINKEVIQENEVGLKSILPNNKFYDVMKKLVKGVNLIENLRKNAISTKIKINPLNLSNGVRQDWLTSTFKLFDYALQYSNKDDAIRNTTFALFDNYLKNTSQHRTINEEIKLIPTLKDFVTKNKEKFSDESVLNALYMEEDRDVGCYGIMGSILMFRIFPELKQIFSSNQFGEHDSLITLANKFHFSNTQSLADQFNAQASPLLDISKYDNEKKLFNNTDYLIMITNGFTRIKVVKDRKYISRYNCNESNNTIDKLELYELIGIQLCRKGNTNYMSISETKLDDSINFKSNFGRFCIANKLKPMQALYKRISQSDYNEHMK